MKKFIVFSILLSMFGLNTFAQSKQFLYIKFTPADATLSINGVEQETTDGVFEDLMLLNKEYSCTVSKEGYTTERRNIVMRNPNETYVIKINLKKVPKYGSLLVKSTPSRADIIIDGQFKGQTPRYIPEILVGEHKVSVFGVEHTINIEEGKESELIVTENNDANNSTSSSDSKIQEEEEEDDEPIPFQFVTEKPSFQGGDMNTFSKWVHENLVYPEIAKNNGVQGSVTLQFTVKKDGSISNIRVLRGVDPSLDKEAIRVVSSSPKWKPGKVGDREVSVNYTFPVRFYIR